MAALHTIKDAMIVELSEDIRKTPIRRAIDARLKYVEFKEDDNNRDIRSTSVDSRVFQIYEPDQVGNGQIGSTTSHPVFDVRVVFSYSSAKKWEAVALDEMDYIRRQVSIIPSRIDGVAARFVKADSTIVREKSSDDARIFMTLTVTFHTEVTYEG